MFLLIENVLLKIKTSNTQAVNNITNNLKAPLHFGDWETVNGMLFSDSS